MPNVLSKIKPEYPNLVKYSSPDEPLQDIPDSQPTNASRIDVDEPVNQVDAEEDAAWARQLRQAAQA